jgi:translation initiation factor IF-1
VAGKDAIEVEGVVAETLPNQLFRVELPNGHRLVAHLAGRMRMKFIRPQIGDKVNVRLSPYDLSKGVIGF